jgi:hypothetical protein
VRAFQSTYVGRHDFPKSLPDFLLQQWFTLNDRDRRAIRKAFRSRHRIGAALQLGFIGMTGTTLRSLEYVPAAVLRHLGRQFKQPVPDIATLRTLYRRRRTRFEHQRWAIQQWGLREFDSAIERRLTEHLHARTDATLSRRRLEQAAREWLYRAYVAIPRARTVTVLVRGVVQGVALQDHRDMRRYVTEWTVQGFIKELLSHRPGEAMTYLEWLRRPPRRRSMKTLLELFVKYKWLEGRIGRGLPIPISRERQHVYARRLRRRRSAQLAELPPYRQELEAMCFAAVCLGTLVDDMLRLVEIRITSIWNWGHKVVADRLIPARVRKKSEILAELRRLVVDQGLTDKAFRTKANTLLITDQPNIRSSRAADVREILSRNARRIRPILQLLTKLDLQGDGDGGNGLSWLDGVYDDGIGTFFLDKAPVWARRWKTLIEESDTQTSARAYEAATAWAVRQGLRNGSLYSKYGFDYADPSSHWMPAEIWKGRRYGYQLEKDLPNAEHLYTDRAEAALCAGLLVVVSLNISPRSHYWPYRIDASWLIFGEQGVPVASGEAATFVREVVVPFLDRNRSPERIRETLLSTRGKMASMRAAQTVFAIDHMERRRDWLEADLAVFKNRYQGYSQGERDKLQGDCATAIERWERGN